MVISEFVLADTPPLDYVVIVQHFLQQVSLLYLVFVVLLGDLSSVHVQG